MGGSGGGQCWGSGRLVLLPHWFLLDAWQWLWLMLGEWKWTAGFAAALVALVVAFEVVAMVVFPLFGG